MIEATLSDLRQSASFFKTKEVVHIIEADTLPYRFLISSREKLQKDCDACIYEIRSLSKTRVKEKLSVLNADELKIVQDLFINTLLIIS